MSENRNDANAGSGAATPRGCERAEDFVTHLYGEATPEESKSFRLHLEACHVCREELSALGGVREGLGVWRAEAVSSLPPLDISRAFSAPAASTRATGRTRSASAAFAALREFFSLSPLWLRAGAVAAVVAVCALAALALRTAATERVITERVVTQPAPAPPAQNLYTEEQLKAAVEREVAEATARLKEQQREPRPGGVVNVNDRGGKTRPQAAPAATQRRRRAASREDSLLAEENLPRLSDLLEGSYED